MRHNPSDFGAAAFANACKQLGSIAQINAAAVDACLGWYVEQPDAEAAAMVANSIVFALAQITHLQSPLLLLALDLECANAAVIRAAAD